MRGRLVIAVVLLLLLGLAASVAWLLLGWPPPRLVLKYGIPPYSAPTGKTKTIEGVEFVEISPGCFRMGSDHEAEGGDFLERMCAKLRLPWGDQPKPSTEMPVHWVEFPRGFLIAKHEVTNEQYERFDPEHERSEYSPADRDPVVDVSFEDASAYCTWLSERTRYEVRLPSEAEWECAARAGSGSEYGFGDDEDRIGEYAWCGENSGGRAHEVGTRRANGWGLFDFHGNVWEWCEDTWHDSYEGSPLDGSAWTSGGSLDRVGRGGSWLDSAVGCRSACRSWGRPSNGDGFLGFRPAASGP